MYLELYVSFFYFSVQLHIYILMETIRVTFLWSHFNKFLGMILKQLLTSLSSLLDVALLTDWLVYRRGEDWVAAYYSNNRNTYPHISFQLLLHFHFRDQIQSRYTLFYRSSYLLASYIDLLSIERRRLPSNSRADFEPSRPETDLKYLISFHLLIQIHFQDQIQNRQTLPYRPSY